MLEEAISFQQSAISDQPEVRGHSSGHCSLLTVHWSLSSGTPWSSGMAQNADVFGRLLNEGLTSAAKKQEKSKREIEHLLGDSLGYGVHTIQHWQRGNLPTDSEIVVETVRFVTGNGRVDRQWAQRVLDSADLPTADTKTLLNELFAEKTRVFISYRRGVEPDEPLALEIARALSRDYLVFFDAADAIDAEWSQRVQAELARAEFVVVLLSAESIHSEVVLTEVKRAHDLSVKNGQPRLLPVLINYRNTLPDQFAQRLEDISWVFWNSASQPDLLLEDLQHALAGNDLPLATVGEKAAILAEPEQTQVPSPAPSVEMPEGAIPLDSRYYVVRPTDTVAQAAVSQPRGATIVIKGARQVGKTSLLIRLMQFAKQQGKQVAFLDFQMFRSALGDPDQFFRLFARLIAFRLGLPDETDSVWSFPLTNPFRMTEYMASNILPAVDTPILLAMDEVETVFDTKFRTDFFGMLRAWHSNRAIDPIWKKLDFVLVTSTEPYFFIDNLNQSPFNVGEVVELAPFSTKQTLDLVKEHGIQSTRPSIEQIANQLQQLTSGHPFLTRRALYLLATNRIDAPTLLTTASELDGPFGDHLRRLLLMLYERPGLSSSLKQILAEQKCDDQIAFFRLRGAGFVREERGKVVAANELYAMVFRGHFE